MISLLPFAAQICAAVNCVDDCSLIYAARAERNERASRSGYRLRVDATSEIFVAIAAVRAGDSEYGFSFVFSAASAAT